MPLVCGGAVAAVTHIHSGSPRRNLRRVVPAMQNSINNHGKNITAAKSEILWCRNALHAEKAPVGGIGVVGRKHDVQQPFYILRTALRHPNTQNVNVQKAEKGTQRAKI